MQAQRFSKVTSKGQITIPYNIRQSLNLDTGSRVEFIVHDNNIVLVPINSKLSDLQGLLPKPHKALTIDDINDVIRKKNKKQ